MLSDEEKKAIDYLQLCYDLSTITNESLSKLGIILNLIEKQSKEIEHQKKKNNGLEIKANELNNLADVVKRDYIHKDKIKAKIEEYENKIKKIRSKKLINEPEDTIIITKYTHYISVLQSLLEKE